MAPAEQPPQDNTGKILGGVGIGLGILIAIPACCVLVAAATIVMLALLGPAIGNVFSDIIQSI
jgi:hypothetical protein